jgi:hypothetical protein
MAFPLNWYAKFYQAIALRGASITYLWQEIGGFLILLTAIAVLLTLTIAKDLKSAAADSGS